MAGVEKSPYIEVPVNCPNCQTKQIVHVMVRAGAKQFSNQVISCAKCRDQFSVLVHDDIIDGPFAA
jgi:hypothetical protein